MIDQSGKVMSILLLKHIGDFLTSCVGINLGVSPRLIAPHLVIKSYMHLPPSSIVTVMYFLCIHTENPVGIPCRIVFINDKVMKNLLTWFSLW